MKVFHIKNFAVWVSVMLALLWWVVRISSAQIYDGARLPELADGIAHLPYQFRALVPWMVSVLRLSQLGGILATTTDSLTFGWLQELSKSHFDYCPPELLIWFLGIDLAFLILLVWQLRELGSTLVPERYPTTVRKDLVVWVFFYAAFWNYIWCGESPWWFSSDVPGIALFVTGIVSIIHSKHILSCLILLFGSLNKETALFLIPFFFLIHDGPMPLWKVSTCTGGMFGIWASIKALLASLYRDNRGFFFHPNAINNLLLLQTPQAWWELVKNAGFLWVPVLVLQFQLPDRTVRCLAWTNTLFFMGILFGGRVSELRAYGESLPLIAVLSVVIALRRLETHDKKQDPPHCDTSLQ